MNVLANEINLLDCEMRKTKRDQIIVASRQDSLLAARQLGLPTCQTIQATEKMAIIHQCENLNMEVKAEITRCGPQPRLGNHSIEVDGWRLAPFSVCRFTSEIIPLNGEFFRYENGEWVAVEAKNVLSTLNRIIYYSSIVLTTNFLFSLSFSNLSRSPHCVSEFTGINAHS